MTETNDESREATAEDVKLSFTGFSADKGAMDAHHLARALDGWCEFWHISAAIYLKKDFSSKSLPENIRPQITVRAFEKNSFDVFAQVLLPLTLTGGYETVKALWKWRRSLLRKHIANKRGFVTREEALHALELLAKDFEIEAANRAETARVVDSIDDALNDLVQPIDRSARNLTLSTSAGKGTIRLTSKDKRALKSGYHVESSLQSKGFQRHSVRFIRINTETGNSLITFDNPSGLHQMGHEYAQIVDSQVNCPRNIYTRALYEGNSVVVWARMMRRQKSNKFVHWEITTDIPEDTTPLFDLHGDNSQ